jgi:hypothetical protein
MKFDSLFFLLWHFSCSQTDCDKLMSFLLDVFDKPAVHFHNFLVCCPSQRSARSQVPSQVATHQEIGSQLWVGERPNSNPGLQDFSLARYHWATTPPTLSHQASHIEPPCLPRRIYVWCYSGWPPPLLCCTLALLSPLSVNRFHKFLK